MTIYHYLNTQIYKVLIDEGGDFTLSDRVPLTDTTTVFWALSMAT